MMKHHKLTCPDMLVWKLNILEEPHQQLDTYFFMSSTKHNEVDVGGCLSESVQYVSV